MDIKELLKRTGCNCIEDVWGYICYLKGVQEDYEFVKNNIEHLAHKIENELY